MYALVARRGMSTLLPMVCPARLASREELGVGGGNQSSRVTGFREGLEASSRWPLSGQTSSKWDGAVVLDERRDPVQ